MHLLDGIIGERMFGLFRGTRTVKVAKCVHDMRNLVEKQRCKDRNQEVNLERKEWQLSKAQQNEVDRRWASVELPHIQKTNYVPFADNSTFTSADWLHLMVYTGRWIMDGILFGMQLAVWIRLCRVVETLAGHKVSKIPLIHEAMLDLVIETVVLCEYYLPATESVIKFHNLIHLVFDIIDKGPVHGFWLFRFERQWGAVTQPVRAHSNRAQVEGSMIRIIKGLWRFVEPIFQKELTQAAKCPRKFRAIQSWQDQGGAFNFFDGQDEVAIFKGGWELVAEMKKGDADIEETLVAMTTDLQQDMIPGDLISLEVCSGLAIMGRDFKPYSGSYNSRDIFPFQKRQFFLSFVSVNANRSVQRYSKCAGQVQGIYCITIRRGEEVIFKLVVGKMILFEIHQEELNDPPDDFDVQFNIIKQPFYWQGRGGAHKRPRYIGVNEIYSACTIVPRVRVEESTIDDLRYHEYHLIQLRRE